MCLHARTPVFVSGGLASFVCFFSANIGSTCRTLFWTLHQRSLIGICGEMCKKSWISWKGKHRRHCISSLVCWFPLLSLIFFANVVFLWLLSLSLSLSLGRSFSLLLFLDREWGHVCVRAAPNANDSILLFYADNCCYTVCEAILWNSELQSNINGYFRAHLGRV